MTQAVCAVCLYGPPMAPRWAGGSEVGHGLQIPSAPDRAASKKELAMGDHENTPPEAHLASLLERITTAYQGAIVCINSTENAQRSLTLAGYSLCEPNDGKTRTVVPLRRIEKEMREAFEHLRHSWLAFDSELSVEVKQCVHEAILANGGQMPVLMGGKSFETFHDAARNIAEAFWQTAAASSNLGAMPYWLDALFKNDWQNWESLPPESRIAYLREVSYYAKTMEISFVELKAGVSRENAQARIWLRTQSQATASPPKHLAAPKSDSHVGWLTHSDATQAYFDMRQRLMADYQGHFDISYEGAGGLITKACNAEQIESTGKRKARRINPVSFFNWQKKEEQRLLKEIDQKRLFPQNSTECPPRQKPKF